jgi:hypothetical protein
MRRLLKRLLRPLLTLPDDGAALWVREAPTAGRGLDVLRVGSCEFRLVETSHTLTSPVGYPAFIAEELARHGVGLGWQNLFAWNFEELPDRRTLLKRRRAHRGAPDVVIVGAGMYYAIRHVFGHGRRVVALRENLGRWAGPLIFPISRVNALCLRHLGRPAATPYRGTAPVERFVADVRAVWPDARILFQEPFMTAAFDGQVDPRRLRRIRDDMLALAQRLDGVDWLPAPDLGTSMAYRGANGVNLNRAGSERAGRAYAQWLLAHGYVRDRGPAQTQSRTAAPQT